ncbi:hypothetical protein FAEUMB_17340 [Faecalimonas umbilicata]|uniref:Uncharacterized protein n=1 Tax=Faecalimonas umbilicata TaxID=1912855 RepID=A0ABQ0QXR2_9FIRM|nr:hypothetical protein FAEUMB_17340 [Faecalimonas umbilicata]
MQSQDCVGTCKVSQISIQEFGKTSRKETMLEDLAWYNGHQQQTTPTGRERMDTGSQIQMDSSHGLIP